MFWNAWLWRMSNFDVSVMIMVSAWNWRKFWAWAPVVALFTSFCAFRMSLRMTVEVAHGVDTAKVWTLALFRNSDMNAESQSRRMVLVIWVICWLTLSILFRRRISEEISKPRPRSTTETTEGIPSLVVTTWYSPNSVRTAAPWSAKSGVLSLNSTTPDSFLPAFRSTESATNWFLAISRIRRGITLGFLIRSLTVSRTPSRDETIG